MYFGTPEDRALTVVFNSQWPPRVFELCFSGVRQIHIIGWQDRYSCEITDASLYFAEGLLPGAPENLIVWADCEDFDPKTADGGIREPADTYIVANDLKWRIIA